MNFLKDYNSNKINKYFVTDAHDLQMNCTIHLFIKVSDEDFSTLR